MTQQQLDELYMRRCLQIARGGLLTAKPNPSVGAVIVAADGRIIGEGFTAPYGGPHAEVNAFAAVSADDEPLLKGATIYVSLEPCAHWGHTPPCCDLIISKGVRRCVCGCTDPYVKVQGEGIRRIREAGVEVTVGVLADDCRKANRAFMTTHQRQRPYVILKWAETANHIIGRRPASEQGTAEPPLRLSSAFTQMMVHQLRAGADAILVGRGTLEADRPQLNVREWWGRSPERMVLTTHPERVPGGYRTFSDIDSLFEYMMAENRQTLLVEGGTQTLNTFIAAGQWDEMRVETAPFTVEEGVAAPALPPAARLAKTCWVDGRCIRLYERDEEAEREKNLINPPICTK